MTCIVGLEHEDSVYIGGDSVGIDSRYDLSIVSEPKVFKVEDFLVGYTTSFRMGQLLQYNLSVEPQRPNTRDLDYLVSAVIPAFRVVLKDGGFLKIEHNVETSGLFLIGYKGLLYRTQSDFSVLRHRNGLDAVGCGAAYAIGALAALDEEEPKKRIVRALKVAGLFSAGVRGPYYVESL